MKRVFLTALILCLSVTLFASCGTEIVPNVIISTDSFDYRPCLSGTDSTLVTEDGVYDFSTYEEILEYFGIANGADSIFCGS